MPDLVTLCRSPVEALVRLASVAAVTCLLGAAACGSASNAAGERTGATDPLAPTETAPAPDGEAKTDPTATGSEPASAAAAQEPTVAAEPEPTVSATSEPGPTEVPTPVAVPAGSVAVCATPAPTERGSLANDDIIEASGITRSDSHDGWWVHNDGGRPELFAISATGADLGTVLLEGVDLWDVEDMTSWQRNGQRELLLADIGDNFLRQGGEHPLVIVTEPRADTASVPARVVTMRYPDGPHNAEVILADGATGEIVIVTKEEDPDRRIQPELLDARVYVGTLGAEEVLDLTFAGSISISELFDRSADTRDHPFSLAGRGGVFTGGEVSADGTVIALRTYGTVWVWDRPTDMTLAETLTASTPCEAAGPFEVQGESLAFAQDGSWTTVSEGRGSPVWSTD